MTSTAHAKSARAALTRGFRDELSRLPDRLLESLWPEQGERYGARAVTAALAPKLWADAAGERLATGELVRILGVSRQALAKRVAAGRLLGLPGNGTTVYPTWQFDVRADPVRVRPAVAAAFAAWVEEAGGLDPFAVTSWAATAQPELDDLTPVEWLAKDGDEQSLADSARITAARLTQ